MAGIEITDVADGHALVLAPEPLSTRTARRFVYEIVSRLGFDDLANTAMLAVSEFVTNAALHARTPIEVRVVALADGVRVEVSDASPLLPARRAYGGFATTGRGLPLVTQLVTRVGLEPRAVGKTMWFELVREVTAAEPAAAWDEDLEWLAQPDLPAGPAPETALLGALPVALWLAAQQHHDALLRELAMHIGSDADPDGDDAHAAMAEARITEAVERAISGVSGMRGVPGETADVSVTLDARSAEDFAALQEVLDNGERLASDGFLLASAGLPEIVAVRDWCCEQIIAQFHGVAPSRWGGLDRELFTSTEHDRFQARAVVWSDEEVRISQACLIAGDDNDRILAVSPPAADLLGWTAEQLVSRRVVTLIPPSLREAHVTGFTRHMTNGSSHVLGVDLQLPVLRADGSEILCWFRLERLPAADGAQDGGIRRGAVYVARISPVEDTLDADDGVP